jgi:hypothetical protein
MSITIYRDSEANAIFIEDANGAQFLNSLHATVDSNLVSITDTAKNFDLVSDVDHTEIVDQNGDVYGATSTEACDALNVIFTTSGSTGEAPLITSNTTINLTEGDTINYELTADYGVGYEWDSLPSGVVTVDGNIRKLIGGSSLLAGTYTPKVKAINYFGEDQETITINVSNPSFANSKSIQFQNQDYLGANASLLDSVLGRAGNGSGSGDAWSVSFYFKAGTSSNNNQTIFYFGSNDVNNGNHIKVTYQGGISNGRNINFKYGSNFNYLNLITPLSSVPQNSWCHVMITYDGGTTGSSSGSINDYYSRFKIYIDGNQQTTSNFNLNYGNTTSLSGQNLRLGRYNSSAYMRNSCKIDELAIFDSDQSGNISSIYNSGAPFDLSTLGTQPKHWWRMGDGDTYPLLQDSGTEANCVFQMYNMTVADIVNDVP